MSHRAGGPDSQCVLGRGALRRGALRWTTVTLLSLVVMGCGGATRDKPNGAMTVQGGAGGSPASSPANGGNEPSGGKESFPSDLKLDDTFPWFVEAGGKSNVSQKEGEGDDKLVHAVFAGAPVQATISTHNHFNVVGNAKAVLFAAKASADVTLLVSVRNSVDGADYFAAEAAGQPWPVAAVGVGTEWYSYAVAFADMMPPAVPEPAQMPAFMIAFIVQHPTAPLELWFDEVRFE